MKTILIALATTLLASAGCRERPTTVDDDDRPVAGKPVEITDHDDDFVQTRTSYETSIRERLDRLSTRIDQLESRADAAGHDAAIKLRAQRDELSARAKEIANQTETGWDRFEGDLSRAVDQLEHDVDQLVD
jgi:hypothetical protein